MARALACARRRFCRKSCDLSLNSSSSSPPPSLPPPPAFDGKGQLCGVAQIRQGRVSRPSFAIRQGPPRPPARHLLRHPRRVRGILPHLGRLEGVSFRSPHLVHSPTMVSLSAPRLASWGALEPESRRCLPLSFAWRRRQVRSLGGCRRWRPGCCLPRPRAYGFGNQIGRRRHFARRRCHIRAPADAAPRPAQCHPTRASSVQVRRRQAVKACVCARACLWRCRLTGRRLDAPSSCQRHHSQEP